MLQHHLRIGPEHTAGNGDLGRYVLLPGSDARASRIASHFEHVTIVDNPRGYRTHLGTLTLGGQTVDVAVSCSGMGPGSAEVITHELIAAGARRIVRVGSCGAMNQAMTPGQVAILTGAVRDEQTTRHMAPVEVPALSHPEAVAAMVAGARAAGLADHAFVGIGHTKASLYAREFGEGPLGADNLAYGRVLRDSGAIASDMEASVLFVLASIASAGGLAPLSAGNRAVPVQAACVLGVYGGDDSHMDLDPALCSLADERAIQTALHGVMDWARRDGVI